MIEHVVNKITILQLTDLHYGTLEPDVRGFKHEWPKDCDSSFATSCLAALKDANLEPDIVAVCGDMVCRGSNVDQHKEAADQLRFLCTELGFHRSRDWARLIVVPGNHDVSRDENTVKHRLKNHVEHFLRPLYRDADPATRRERIPPATFHLASLPRKCPWSRVVRVAPFPLEFVLFQTPIADDEILMPKMLKGQLPQALTDDQKADRKRVAWMFDRGHISADQITAFENSLEPLGHAWRSTLRVALLHHNLMPIPRRHRNENELTEPEFSLLANGMEIAERLIAKDISVVLHGHRHQYAIGVRSRHDPEKQLVAFGAPTAGLDRRYENVNPGFNILQIFKTNLGWSASVLPFTYTSDEGTGQEKFRHLPALQARIDIRRDGEPYELLTAHKAVRSLGESLAKSRRGPTILHFTATAKWHASETPRVAPTAQGTPFERLWAPLKKEQCSRSLAKILWGTADVDRKGNVIKALAYKSFQQGYLDSSLVRSLQDKHSEFILDNMNAHRSEPFFAHILDNIYEWSDRNANYAIELFRLSTDRKFTVTKCVHICPARLQKPFGPEWRRTARLKFAWLVNTALACRGLPNCRVAFMPFCFEEGFDQTMVSIDGGTEAREKPGHVLIGWGPGDQHARPLDPELRNDHDFTVLHLDEQVTHLNRLGDLGRDIRGFLERSIHPLSERLVYDFPILLDGKVFINNIETIARICHFEIVMRETTRILQDSRRYTNSSRTSINTTNLEALFRWVLNRDVMRRLKEKQGILPWLDRDLELTLRELKRQ